MKTTMKKTTGRLGISLLFVSLFATGAMMSGMAVAQGDPLNPNQNVIIPLANKDAEVMNADAVKQQNMLLAEAQNPVSPVFTQYNRTVNYVTATYGTVGGIEGLVQIGQTVNSVTYGSDGKTVIGTSETVEQWTIEKSTGRVLKVVATTTSVSKSDSGDIITHTQSVTDNVYDSIGRLSSRHTVVTNTDNGDLLSDISDTVTSYDTKNRAKTVSRTVTQMTDSGPQVVATLTIANTYYDERFGGLRSDLIAESKTTNHTTGAVTYSGMFNFETFQQTLANELQKGTPSATAYEIAIAASRITGGAIEYWNNQGDKAEHSVEITMTPGAGEGGATYIFLETTTTYSLIGNAGPGSIREEKLGTDGQQPPIPAVNQQPNAVFVPPQQLLQVPNDVARAPAQTGGVDLHAQSQFYTVNQLGLASTNLNLNSHEGATFTTVTVQYDLTANVQFSSPEVKIYVSLYDAQGNYINGGNTASSSLTGKSNINISLSGNSTPAYAEITIGDQHWTTNGPIATVRVPVSL